MNDTATEPKAQPPALATFKRLRDCKTLQDAFQSDELRSLVAAAAPKFLDPVAMLRTWIQAAAKQPLIYKADLRQALGAFQSLAFLGLQPNTHLNLAHIIPFKKKSWNPATRKRDKESIEIQVIIGYPGYIELAHRSGVVKALHADVVYDARAEEFEFEYGTNQHLRHRGQPPGYKAEGDPLYAYAWFKLEHSDQFEVMPWSDVVSIRNRSQAYRTAKSAHDQAVADGKRIPLTYLEAPWIRDASEMGKKSACRRGMKWLPKCPELRAAAALEDAQDGGTLDWGPVIDGTSSPLDGDIPQAEEHEEPRDPTATASLQSQRPSQKRPAPKITEAPDLSFEAGIIDEYGEVASDVFTDPARFATALRAHYEAMPDKGMAGALLDHNADALDALKGIAAANKIIAEMFSEDEVTVDEVAEEEEAPSYVAQTVVGGTTTREWSAYPSNIKTSLQGVPDDRHSAELWIDAQRDALTRAPAAQRLLAVHAIAGFLTKRGMSSPPWMSELIKPKAAVESGDEAQVVAFERNVDQYLKIESPTDGLAQFNAYAKSVAVQTVMKRLREENAPLYERAYKAFDTVQNELRKRQPA